MKIKKYDYWIGLYEDKVKGIFYVCLWPCFVLKIQYIYSFTNIEIKLVRLYLYTLTTLWFIFLGVIFHKFLFFIGL